MLLVTKDHRAFRLLPDAQDLIFHLVTGLRVQVPERFVHQQHFRIVAVRPGNAHPLLHAAGKLVWIGMLETRQAHQLDEVRRFFFPLLAPQPRSFGPMATFSITVHQGNSAMR